MSANLKRLAEASAQIAAQGAQSYLRSHSLEAEPIALANALRASINARLAEALQDAKDALAVKMDAVAVQTFAASMLQAGIEAAREVGFHNYEGSLAS